MATEIVGEKEIAFRLRIREATVHQWMSRGLLPDPEGSVSASPAWHWSTIEEWAWRTGRMPHIHDQILALLHESPTGGSFTTPITKALIDAKAVGPETTPVKVAGVLTDLVEEGFVSIHLRNEWRITDDGRRQVAEHREDLHHSTPLGLAWRPDFPQDAYVRLNDGVAAWQPKEPDLYAEYAGGWKGIGYRFNAADECSERFMSSLLKAGNSPPPAERYIQDRELFGFFVNSLSTLESAAYAFYAMAGMVDPGHFPLSTDRDKKNATLRNTQLGYLSRFPAEELTQFLGSLVNAPEFGELKRIRNVLAHAAAPPRRFFRGGPRDGQAEWSAFGLTLDQDTTTVRRQWLVGVLGRLLEAAANFAVRHL